jgi:hypothetical protein
VGNLQNFSYPNGVTSAYSYDALNRLAQVGSSKSATSISNYAYTLGAAGNRLTVGRVAQAFKLPGVCNKKGAPSFAHFAKGGNHEHRRNRVGNPWTERTLALLLCNKIASPLEQSFFSGGTL